MLVILKYVISLVVCVTAFTVSYAQDIIYLKDYSDTIKCNIVKDNIKNVEYRLANSNDSSLHIISINDIEGYVLMQNIVDTVKYIKVIYTERDSAFLKGDLNYSVNQNKYRITPKFIMSTIIRSNASNSFRFPVKY